ncbi:MAG: hypothetical protein K2M08_07850 [Anaeroplasmataceae bacterium]|nr:hypothetical protein [Anaeroplasmataceae bacterium]
MKRKREKIYKVLAYKYAYRGNGKVLVLGSIKYCVVVDKIELLTYIDILKEQFSIDRVSIHRVNPSKIVSIGEWVL